MINNEANQVSQHRMWGKLVLEATAVNENRSRLPLIRAEQQHNTSSIDPQFKSTRSIYTSVKYLSTTSFNSHPSSSFQNIFNQIIITRVFNYSYTKQFITQILKMQFPTITALVSMLATASAITVSYGKFNSFSPH